MNRTLLQRHGAGALGLCVAMKHMMIPFGTTARFAHSASEAKGSRTANVANILPFPQQVSSPQTPLSRSAATPPGFGIAANYGVDLGSMVEVLQSLGTRFDATSLGEAFSAAGGGAVPAASTRATTPQRKKNSRRDTESVPQAVLTILQSASKGAEGNKLMAVGTTCFLLQQLVEAKVISPGAVKSLFTQTGLYPLLQKSLSAKKLRSTSSPDEERSAAAAASPLSQLPLEAIKSIVDILFVAQIIDVDIYRQCVAHAAERLRSGMVSEAVNSLRFINSLVRQDAAFLLRDKQDLLAAHADGLRHLSRRVEDSNSKDSSTFFAQQERAESPRASAGRTKPTKPGGAKSTPTAESIFGQMIRHVEAIKRLDPMHYQTVLKTILSTAASHLNHSSATVAATKRKTSSSSSASSVEGSSDRNNTKVRTPVIQFIGDALAARMPDDIVTTSDLTLDLSTVEMVELGKLCKLKGVPFPKLLQTRLIKGLQAEVNAVKPGASVTLIAEGISVLVGANVPQSVGIAHQLTTSANLTVHDIINGFLILGQHTQQLDHQSLQTRELATSSSVVPSSAGTPAIPSSPTTPLDDSQLSSRICAEFLQKITSEFDVWVEGLSTAGKRSKKKKSESENAEDESPNASIQSLDELEDLLLTLLTLGAPEVTEATPSWMPIVQLWSETAQRQASAAEQIELKRSFLTKIVGRYQHPSSAPHGSTTLLSNILSLFFSAQGPRGTTDASAEKDNGGEGSDAQVDTAASDEQTTTSTKKKLATKKTDFQSQLSIFDCSEAVYQIVGESSKTLFHRFMGILEVMELERLSSASAKGKSEGVSNAALDSAKKLWCGRSLSELTRLLELLTLHGRQANAKLLEIVFDVLMSSGSDIRGGGKAINDKKFAAKKEFAGRRGKASKASSKLRATPVGQSSSAVGISVAQFFTICCAAAKVSSLSTAWVRRAVEVAPELISQLSKQQTVELLDVFANGKGLNQLPATETLAERLLSFISTLSVDEAVVGLSSFAKLGFCVGEALEPLLEKLENAVLTCGQAGYIAYALGLAKYDSGRGPALIQRCGALALAEKAHCSASDTGKVVRGFAKLVTAELHKELANRVMTAFISRILQQRNEFTPADLLRVLKGLVEARIVHSTTYAVLMSCVAEKRSKFDLTQVVEFVRIARETVGMEGNVEKSFSTVARPLLVGAVHRAFFEDRSAFVTEAVAVPIIETMGELCPDDSLCLDVIIHCANQSTLKPGILEAILFVFSRRKVKKLDVLLKLEHLAATSSLEEADDRQAASILHYFSQCDIRSVSLFEAFERRAAVVVPTMSGDSLALVCRAYSDAGRQSDSLPSILVPRIGQLLTQPTAFSKVDLLIDVASYLFAFKLFRDRYLADNLAAYCAERASEFNPFTLRRSVNLFCRVKLSDDGSAFAGAAATQAILLAADLEPPTLVALLVGFVKFGSRSKDLYAVLTRKLLENERVLKSRPHLLEQTREVLEILGRRVNPELFDLVHKYVSALPSTPTATANFSKTAEE